MLVMGTRGSVMTRGQAEHRHVKHGEGCQVIASLSKVMIFAHSVIPFPCFSLFYFLLLFFTFSTFQIYQIPVQCFVQQHGVHFALPLSTFHWLKFNLGAFTCHVAISSRLPHPRTICKLFKPLSGTSAVQSFKLSILNCSKGDLRFGRKA